jgi:transcriptional regulator with XRE-family HTH domain
MNKDTKEIKKLLIDAGKTQQDVANELNTTVQYVNAVVQGRRNSPKILDYLESLRQCIKVNLI